MQTSLDSLIIQQLSDNYYNNRQVMELEVSLSWLLENNVIPVVAKSRNLQWLLENANKQLTQGKPVVPYFESLQEFRATYCMNGEGITILLINGNSRVRALDFLVSDNKLPNGEMVRIKFEPKEPTDLMQPLIVDTEGKQEVLPMRTVLGLNIELIKKLESMGYSGPSDNENFEMLGVVLRRLDNIDERARRNEYTNPSPLNFLKNMSYSGFRNFESDTHDLLEYIGSLVKPLIDPKKGNQRLSYKGLRTYLDFLNLVKAHSIRESFDFCSTIETLTMAALGKEASMFSELYTKLTKVPEPFRSQILTTIWNLTAPERSVRKTRFVLADAALYGYEHSTDMNNYFFNFNQQSDLVKAYMFSHLGEKLADQELSLISNYMIAHMKGSIKKDDQMMYVASVLESYQRQYSGLEVPDEIIAKIQEISEVSSGNYRPDKKGKSNRKPHAKKSQNSVIPEAKHISLSFNPEGIQIIDFPRVYVPRIVEPLYAPPEPNDEITQLFLELLTRSAICRNVLLKPDHAVRLPENAYIFSRGDPVLSLARGNKNGLTIFYEQEIMMFNTNELYATSNGPGQSNPFWIYNGEENSGAVNFFSFCQYLLSIQGLRILAPYQHAMTPLFDALRTN